MSNIQGRIGTPKTSIKGVVTGYIQTSFSPISQDIPSYQGEYEFFPTAEQQTIPTSGKALENDIVIRANPYDANTSDANATSGEILSGKTAYVNKQKVIGSMPDNGTVNANISSVAQTVSISEGYHDGNGSVSISGTEQAKIIAENIKSGVSILGVQGTHEGGIDTTDATAANGDILATKIAYVNGEKVTGAMPNRGAINGEISTVSGSFTIQNGYHNGAGKVFIKSSEQAKIIPNNIKDGITILGVNGTNKGIDTSDATATEDEILENKTAYINGQKLIGTMYNRGAVNGEISYVSGTYSIREGYHNGNGSVAIANSEKAKIIPANIKSGISILGVNGTCHDGIVNLAEATNEAGGTTIIIGENEEDTLHRVILINDTVSPLVLLKDYTAHDSDGNAITGIMPNKGAINAKISSVTQSVSIPEGYHNGEGSVSILSAEQAKIIPENIKSGISILGVTGAYEAIGSSLILPYISDYPYGYLSANEWKYYSSGNKHYSDIYTVQANHSYFLTSGQAIGNRFIVCFFTVDVSTTTINTTGVAISDTTDTSSAAFRNATYTPESNGYIVVYKGNNNLTGIKTYFYDVTENWL